MDLEISEVMPTSAQVDSMERVLCCDIRGGNHIDTGNCQILLVISDS